MSPVCGVARLVHLRVRALTERLEHLVAVDQIARLVSHQDEPRRKKPRFAAAAGYRPVRRDAYHEARDVIRASAFES